jgi:hypothetical protein
VIKVQSVVRAHFAKKVVKRLLARARMDAAQRAADAAKQAEENRLMCGCLCVFVSVSVSVFVRGLLWSKSRLVCGDPLVLSELFPFSVLALTHREEKRMRREQEAATLRIEEARQQVRAWSAQLNVAPFT